MRFKKLLSTSGLLLIFFISSFAHAQFSGGLQGSVQDSTAAAIPGAALTLTNTATNVSQTVQSDAKGDYRFLSLAPGNYIVSATANGFGTSKVPFTLSTAQLMNIPITLVVATSQQVVQVSDRAPVLDTAESRTQLTIDTEALDSLPLPGRNQLGLVTLAPGVTGLGVQGNGGNGQSTDNYGSETQVSASANGRSSVGNMYVVDGLDITSNITPGVLNLVPNPDTIQEATVQVNTFDVEYGRSSSIVEVMTTRSGADRYHFLASQYYTADWLTARTEFQPKENYKMLPFHSTNISTTLSGPVPFLKNTFFFTGWEPLLSSTQSNSLVTYEDPQFTAWAKANWPNSIGVKLLDQYPATNVSTTGVAQTGATLFKGTCGTAAAANIPCSLPVVDSGVLAATNYRDALQWNARVDKVFSKDRIYGNYFQTRLDLGGPSVRVDHNSPQHYSVRSVQGNETHTFNSNTVNEAAFGWLRMEGLINPTGPFRVPIITLTSGWGTQLGVSKADENYVQHHTVWKDTLSHVFGSHNLRFGYEGFWGDNLTFFGPWNSQPSYSFQTVSDFVQDKIFTESGVSFDLLTGQQAGLRGGSFQFDGNMTGLFAQDTWKLNKKMTLTYGLRWDDFGNPSPQKGTISSNFFYGPGQSITDQVANGYVKQVTNVFNHSIMAWSPRVGLAWDLTGQGKWMVRGGFGLYHDWVTLGNVQNEFANPPAPATVTFQSNTSGIQPVYSVGTSDTYPYGFTYPDFKGYTLNDHGGIAGLQVNVGGNDPNLKASNTLNYTVTLERGITNDYSVAVGYSGSHSNNLFTGFASRTTNANYGVDINTFPGSLIVNKGKFVRLNTNFGSVRYTVNGPTSTYNAFIASFKGRVMHHGFITASYTRSNSYDSAGTYPTALSNTGDYSQYWGLSNWDTPNRLSLALAYELPGLKRGPAFLHYLTNGWKPSGITILQSGTPFTVLQTASYSQGGDYNADGNNSDLPNIPTYGYSVPTDRNSQLGRNSDRTPNKSVAGVFGAATDFTPPANLPAEGNQAINGYRNPGYANTDFALLKNNRIREFANLQLRLEVFNLFNRASLGGISSTLTSSTFGRATSQYPSRFLQLGARFEF
jgi:carboxypeptidase family protein